MHFTDENAMVKKLFLLVLFSFLYSCSSQPKEEWLKLRPYKIASLEKELKEISGLFYLDSQLYALNDGGNPAALYRLDPGQGSVRSRVDIAEKNRDWEALTGDGRLLYVGDFGNNWGNRRDLKIHKVVPESGEILRSFSFDFEEQKEIRDLPHAHDFDMEAMVFDKRMLHLFTKEWKSLGTSRYELDPTMESGLKQTLKRKERIELGYLVTDAAVHEETLYLIGYTRKMEVYLSVFQRDSRGNYFSLPYKKHYLGLASGLGQIESLTATEKGLYIAGERFTYKFLSAEPMLYFVPFEKLR